MTLQLHLEIEDAVRSHPLTVHVDEQLQRGTLVLADAGLDEAIDPASLVGKAGTLRLTLDDEDVRFWHGVVIDAALLGTRPLGEAGADVFLLRAVLATKLDLLRLGRDCRIFQDKSVPDIVKEVIDGAGIGLAHSWFLSGSYAPREYVVQHNESDLDLVQRLLASEGIGFLVRNGPGDEELVLFDDDRAWEALPDGALLTDLDAAATASFGHASVTGCRHRFAVASDAVMLRDYDFRRPALDLSTKAATGDTTGREVYAHPGGFRELAVGKRLATRLLERLRVGTERLSARCHHWEVEPGRKISLQGHGRASLNADHVVISVRHTATRPPGGDGIEYHNDLVAIPAAVPYRPPAPPPHHPSTTGVMLAFNTVPGGGGGGLGEEIHNDEHGRVKARFPWDRAGITDDKSSTFMRVGQLPLSGPMILPRKDFELVVDFETGDLDRPFVTGHLYHRELPPPYALPGGKTRSALQSATTDGGAGANEIRFEDAAGSEEIFFNASKDAISLVDDDASWSITTDDATEIGSNHTVSIGGNHTAMVTGSRTLSVGGNKSVNVTKDYTDTVGGSLTLDISGMRKVTVGGDYLESTTGGLTRDVSALQSVTAIAGYSRQVVASSKTNVGAAWLEIAAGSRMVSVGTVFSETVGALKFIKSKTFALSAVGAYALTGAAHSVKAGGGRTDDAKGAVAVSAAGGVKVKATKINIEATSKLVISTGAGASITLSGGSCTIKGTKVDLTGVKSVAAAMNKNN